MDGVPDCYYRLLESLDSPFKVGTSITWIEGARSAFGLYEFPNGYKEDHQNTVLMKHPRMGLNLPWVKETLPGESEWA